MPKYITAVLEPHHQQHHHQHPEAIVVVEEEEEENSSFESTTTIIIPNQFDHRQKQTFGYRLAKFFLLSPYYAIGAATIGIAAISSGVAVVATAHHSPLLFFSDDDISSSSTTTQSSIINLSSPSAAASASGAMNSTTTARIDFIAHVYVMPILLIIGFINQCLNIWTLSTMRAAAYLYLKGSAIADILSIFALIPFCLRHGGYSDEHSYLIMFYHAHLELPIINSLITASALCLVVMTIDRYLSIRYPIVFHNSSGARGRIRNTVFLLYFIAFIVFLPSGVQKRLVGVPDSEDALNRTLWRVERNHTINRSIGFIIYLYFRETIARIGPIIILVVLNLGMIRSLQQIDDTRRARASASSMGVPTVARQLRQREDRRRILILLFITSATFVICTLPASALSFFIDHSHRSLGLQIFRAFANCLQVSHYLPHLFLYMLCSIEYRHAFYKIIGCETSTSVQTTPDSPTYRLSSNTVIGRVRSSFRYFPSRRNRRHSTTKYLPAKKANIVTSSINTNNNNNNIINHINEI